MNFSYLSNLVLFVVFSTCFGQSLNEKDIDQALNPKDFDFGMIQLRRGSVETCDQACDSVGGFSSCKFPIARLDRDGFYLEYPKDNAGKPVVKRISAGYSFILRNISGSCFCQMPDKHLTVIDAKEDLTNDLSRFCENLESLDGLSGTILMQDTVDPKISVENLKTVHGVVQKLNLKCKENMGILQQKKDVPTEILEYFNRVPQSLNFKYIIDFDDFQSAESLDFYSKLVEHFQTYRRFARTIRRSINTFNYRKSKNLLASHSHIC